MAACLLKRTNSAVFLGAPSDTANTLLMLCKVGADWPQELPPEEKYLDHVAAPGTDVDCLPGSVCRFPADSHIPGPTKHVYRLPSVGRDYSRREKLCSSTR